MKAVILVGGFGTRLRPLTYTIPKQLLPVVGVPQLERKIEHLASHGIDDIVLSMGYRPDAFQDAYPNGTCAGAKLHYVIEDEPLGTAGAIAYAARQAGIDETFMAMNGDVLTDLDVPALIDLHQRHGAEGTLGLTTVDDPSRFGVVSTDSKGKVLAFIEKPAPGEAPSNLINAGSYVLEPSFLDRVRPGVEVSIEREIFPQMVADERLYAGHFDKYWLDIGTPAAYLQGNLDHLDHHLDGASFIAEDAQVAENAQIDRSVIDTGAEIADSALIVESVILPGAIVEAGATIRRSVVAENAVVGAHATLEDLTVIGASATVPGGATLKGEKLSA